MYAKSYNPRGFASLESVKSASTGKSKLRIRLPKALMDGRSPYLSLGLDDTPKNRSYAERKLESINSDIFNEVFDNSLEKYKPTAKKTPVTQIKKSENPNIVALYAKYIELRRSQVSPNTYAKNYLEWLKRLKKGIPSECLQVSEESALSLLEHCSSHYSVDANKRLFDQLSACSRWAMESGKIHLAVNPYEKIGKQIPRAKKKRRNPAFFTKEEIGQIIQAFAQNQYYSHYTNYISFLFATGARPSEVVCLTWNDIDDRYIHFNKRMVETEKGKVIDQGLKTEDKRRFPINNLIKSILQNQKDRNIDSNLVFPSPKGLMIHIQNFSRRAWKQVLSELEFKYKRPYTSRSSFITHTLEHLDAKDVGRICGNLPETIYRHYASSNIASLIVPETF
jgi:integrase